MQEIVSFCDLHYERSEQRVPGTGFKLGIAGDWKRVDLCPACVAEVLAPLEQTILNHAVAVTEIPIEGKPRYTAQQLEKKVAAMGSPRPCLWCPTTVQGIRELNQHLTQEHGFGDLYEAYGDVCPICQVKQAKLSAHLGRGHMLTLASAFAWAIHSDVRAARELAEERRGRRTKEEPAQLTAELFQEAQARYEDWTVRHGKA